MEPDLAVRGQQSLKVLVMVAVVRCVLLGKALNRSRQLKIMLSCPENVDLKAALQRWLSIARIPEALFAQILSGHKECNVWEFIGHNR
jgi:hypothetical protein